MILGVYMERVEDYKRTNHTKHQVDWNDVKRDYEEFGRSYKELSAKYGIPAITIQRHSVKGLWIKNKKSADLDHLALIDMRRLTKDMRIKVKEVSKSMNTDPDCNLGSISEDLGNVSRMKVVHKTELRMLHVLCGNMLDYLGRLQVTDKNAGMYMGMLGKLTDTVQSVQKMERVVYEADNPINFKDVGSDITQIIDIIQNDNEEQDLLPKV